MAKDNITAATIGFESDLWRAADALRSNMDAAEYKHIVVGRFARSHPPCCLAIQLVQHRERPASPYLNDIRR